MSLFVADRQRHTPVVAHTSTRHIHTHTSLTVYKSLFYRPNKPKKKRYNENNADTSPPSILKHTYPRTIL